MSRIPATQRTWNYVLTLLLLRCLIVRTAPYEKDAIAKVVQLRANVEGLKLGDGVLERLAQKGHDSSLRSDYYSLIRDMCTDAHIVAQICTATTHARVDPCVDFWA